MADSTEVLLRSRSTDLLGQDQDHDGSFLTGSKAEEETENTFPPIDLIPPETQIQGVSRAVENASDN